MVDEKFNKIHKVLGLTAILIWKIKDSDFSYTILKFINGRN